MNARGEQVLIQELVLILFTFLAWEDLRTQHVHTVLVYATFLFSGLYVLFNPLIQLNPVTFTGLTLWILFVAAASVTSHVKKMDVIALVSLGLITKTSLFSIQILLVATGITLLLLPRFTDKETMPGMTVITLTYFIYYFVHYTPLHL